MVRLFAVTFTILGAFSLGFGCIAAVAVAYHGSNAKVSGVILSIGLVFSGLAMLAIGVALHVVERLDRLISLHLLIGRR